MEKRGASLDTSFWVIACRIGVVQYLFDFYEVHYCPAVRNEIVKGDPARPSLIFPQAKMFDIFLEDGRLKEAEPRQRLTVFGAGEAGAIALARERGWDLLINDFRPYHFARSLGVKVVSVPEFCLLLVAAGLITPPAAHGYLDRLRATTSRSLLDLARESLDRLTGNGGDLNEN